MSLVHLKHGVMSSLSLCPFFLIEDKHEKGWQNLQGSWLVVFEKSLQFIWQIYHTLEDTIFSYIYNHYMQRQSRKYLVFSYIFYIKVL